MQFIRFKSIEEKFQRFRKWSVACVLLMTIITLFSIYNSGREIGKARQVIYVLLNGRALQAIVGDQKSNIPVELRDHLRLFHRYFFDLDPDEKAIKTSMNQSFYLADGSARSLYESQVENGFISGLVSGNISQRVQIDSIELDLDNEPYRFRCLGTQTLKRTTTVTTRTFVTRGLIRNVERSDNNSHGFLVERFEIVENKDIKTVNR